MPPPGYGQPSSFGAPPPYAAPPPSHLAWAIITTLLCCLPLGIISILYAAQVNSKFLAGDRAGAEEASRNAKNWAIASAVSIAALALFAVIFGLLSDS